ncbi:hypothetical protein F0562_010259 [Nyssa sinensis]|uniref:TF-B3 domain-containing protein n=1 Tax=Nyssa sinensis TaxID=561372 RepID=A0A5J5A1C0_9ASTE|nr:hypothetical protein F0562_010259 [Nyssa sinensis]
MEILYAPWVAVGEHSELISSALLWDMKVVEDELGIEINPSWSPFENLTVVAKAATIIYEKEKKQQPLPHTCQHRTSQRAHSSSSSSKKPPLPADTCQHRPSLRAQSSKKPPLPESSKGEKKKPHEGTLDMSKILHEMPVACPFDSSMEERQKREGLFKRPVDAKKRVRFEIGESSTKAEAKGKKKIKKTKVIINNTDQNPPPELPVQFKNRIREKGGYDLKFLIQKKLYKTDTSRGHNRLSMPLTQIKDHNFLTDEEKTKINQTKNNEITVEVIGTKLDTYELCFKKWNMKKATGNISSSYVLITGWNSIVYDDKLKKDMEVQVWSFRVNGKLCFAIVKVETGQQQDDGGSGGGGNSLLSSSGHSGGVMASPTSPSHPQQD